MIFVGVDWAEAHHDVHVEDAEGRRLAGGRLPEGVEGIARFHELVGAHAEEPGEVVIGIETDRGLFVGALVASGYLVYAVNPMSTSRYRDRHSSSGAKSDPGDAKVLADMVRTDRHNHRQVAGDSEAVEAVKVLARAHQSMIWSRGRQTNALRSTLREFYPAALLAFDDLSSADATEVLKIAPTPALGRTLSSSKIATALRRGGRQLGARVLGEFGDDPNRYATTKSRKNYAGTSPITRASGTKRVVLARYARNMRLADAIYMWAFASLTASPGARGFYDAHRAAGDTHHAALRALGNRLVGILHGCLANGSFYDEHTAWGHRADIKSAEAA